MPRLRVHKNGEHLCSVGSDDVWMFSASVWAEIFGPEASTLDVTGGAKPTNDGNSEFLIWECPHELSVGDTVELFFEEANDSLPRGSPLKDEVDDSAEVPKFDWSDPPTEEQIRALESREVLNGTTRWSVALDGVPRFEIRPDASRQHVSLHLLWNNDHPERLRVSLSRKSLREIVGRIDGEELLLEHLPIGSSINVTIGA
jgi:hypothetical protein